MTDKEARGLDRTRAGGVAELEAIQMSIPIRFTLEWLAHENAQLNKQVSDLQARGTELVEENRELKRRLAEYEGCTALSPLLGERCVLKDGHVGSHQAMPGREVWG